MTDWKTLQDTNPEPSILDAIVFATGNDPKDASRWSHLADAPHLGQKLKDAATYIATFGQGEDK
jgi:hypothetical protein